MHKQRKCFVIMPFKDKYNGIWENVIKPTVENYGDTCKRADDIFAPGSIINDIIDHIHISDYIIADLTEKNPNVYYELGFTQALNKQVILITQDIDSLPFDVKHQRVIIYSDTVAGAFTLQNDIKKYLANI